MVNPRYIGGFFELEQADVGPCYHTDAIALCNGRACLSVIIDQLEPRKMYMPFYACDALYEPLQGRCNISYYSIDYDLEISDIPELKQDEYLLYIDYFGMKATYIERLKIEFGAKLIIDDTHNFFKKGHQGHWSFCSARKYFGVPDGAYLYSPITVATQYERNTSIRMNYLINRKKGRQELAFAQYQEYEKSLDSSIKLISLTSEHMLDRVDYKKVRDVRRSNFKFLDSELAEFNQISFTASQCDLFCYPLLPSKAVPKRDFHRHNIFIPSLWTDVLRRKETGFSTEKEIARRLIPIPVDHRYKPVDLSKITQLVKEMVLS